MKIFWKFCFILLILCMRTLSYADSWSEIQEAIKTQHELDKIKTHEETSAKRNLHVEEDELIVIGGDEAEHMKNFKKISEGSKVIENEYRTLLDEIPNNDFSETVINSKVGSDFVHVIDDFEYLRR